MSSKTPELEQDDRRHLDAAEGWLGLGNWSEANEELEQISPAMRAHPEVLGVRYDVYSHAAKWDACLDIGEALVKLMPTSSLGWINRSYALRRAPGGGVQAAYEALLPGAHEAKDPVGVFFNLASMRANWASWNRPVNGSRSASTRQSRTGSGTNGGCKP
jgi:hypothetical protein